VVVILKKDQSAADRLAGLFDFETATSKLLTWELKFTSWSPTTNRPIFSSYAITGSDRPDPPSARGSPPVVNRKWDRLSVRAPAPVALFGYREISWLTVST
jgi:hypothetical protein